ncbi:MAG: hypothetical protein ACLGIA_05700 [Actinomycetes bacterium]
MLPGMIARLPPWLQVVGVYALSRVFTWAVTDRVARFQAPNPWTGADPAYLDFVRIWDGEWYRRIAEGGYPLPLPLGSDGSPRQSEWAFFPAYPMLVRGLEDVTRLPFRVVAPTTSVLLGGLAVLVMYRVFRLRADHVTSLVGVALFSAFPTSPVLQYAYTESLAMLALAGAVYLLMTRRYLWCLLPVVLLDLTRPVGVPFGLVVLAHLVHRWRIRRHDALPLRDGAAIVLLGGVAAVSSVAWPVYVGIATGEAHAYTRVQAAWHRGELHWVTPWWDMSQYVLGQTLGPVALVLALLAYALLLVGRGGRFLGPELATWCGAYVAYLVVVLQPFTSLFRYLLLLFPLALVVARPVRTRAHLLAWLVALLSLQVVWIAWLWRFSPPSDMPP